MSLLFQVNKFIQQPLQRIHDKFICSCSLPSIIALFIRELYFGTIENDSVLIII